MSVVENLLWIDRYCGVDCMDFEFCGLLCYDVDC